jgi:hypothetical protein
VPDSRQHPRIGEHSLEDPWLLAELRTRVLAFLCAKPLDARTDLLEEISPPQFVQPLQLLSRSKAGSRRYLLLGL